MSAAWQTWRLAPRDPLVFGRGGSRPAYLPSLEGWLPPQAAAAGLVRSTCAGGGTAVPAEDAQRLLSIRIRGPWLLERQRDGDRLWVPVPSDGVILERDGGASFLRGELRAPGRGQGFSRAFDGQLSLLTFLPSQIAGAKTRRPRFPYRPLDWVLKWNLGDETEVPWPVAGSGRNQEAPIRREARVHVGIDDDSLTAEPEALFGSVGLRFAEGFELAMEVIDGRDTGKAGDSQAPRLVLLGGESRASVVSVADGPIFGGFKLWQPAIEQRISALEARPSCDLGLRLLLLSPASFGGWRPQAWPDRLRGLPLVAAAIGGFDAISGWDLQRRRPRKVRRLVPAGSVYTFGPLPSGQALLDVCRSLWGGSLCEGIAGAPESFLAPPANDGYGTVLPVPCALPKEISS